MEDVEEEELLELDVVELLDEDVLVFVVELDEDVDVFVVELDEDDVVELELDVVPPAAVTSKYAHRSTEPFITFRSSELGLPGKRRTKVPLIIFMILLCH